MNRGGKVGFGRGVLLRKSLSSEAERLSGGAVGRVGVGINLFDDRGGMREVERIVVRLSTDEGSGRRARRFELLARESSSGLRLENGSRGSARG